MRFQTPLVPGTLVRRYKRFLSDIQLDSGEIVTAHCPNSGAMLGLKDPGMRVWLEPNDDPRKKLKYGWRLVELPDGHWAGIDTAVPNRVVKEALLGKQIPELSPYDTVRPEVKYGERSRVDFLLKGDGLPDAYVEVKNVHLRRDGDWAEFPDSVTTRGTKHLRELSKMVAEGHRAIMLYLVQRTDCRRFRLAGDIDADYANAFDDARACGVEVLCYGTNIGVGGVSISNSLKIDSSSQGNFQGLS